MSTTKEALQLLSDGLAAGEAGYDLILKEHELPLTNACKLVRKLAQHESLRQIPVVGESSLRRKRVFVQLRSPSRPRRATHSRWPKPERQHIARRTSAAALGTAQRIVLR